MFKCSKCEEEFDNRMSLSNHLRFHKRYDEIKDDIINDYVNNNLTYRELVDKYNSSPTSLVKILKDVSMSAVDKMRKRNTLSHKQQSDEAKLKISNGRKKWLKENPDSHVWKRKGKFTSKPCEHLKNKFI